VSATSRAPGASAGSGGVGLVHDWLTGQRGGEHVLAALARLAPRAPIYTLFHFPGTVSAEIEAHPIVTSFLQGAPRLRSAYRHYLPLFPAAMRSLDTSRHRLVLSSSHCVAKGARRSPGGFHVCYCHTPMRYAWDQRRAYFPAPRGPVGWLRERILDRLQAWDAATSGRVDLYLANSTFVAGRIARYYGRPAEVLAPPVDTAAFRPTHAPREEFVLVVAALAPYKKVDIAIEACRQAGTPLVIVGDGPERDRLRGAAGPSVRFAGRVEGEELRRLYAAALCYLQTGIEDFGIATVEALACGTPVLALAEGGVLDIVESGRHGLLIADPSAAALADGIDKIRRMQFNSMDLRSRAEEFSAERFTTRLKGYLRPFWPESEGEPF
jgi:glycosyltransferase involved in cell wall biosynthesis